MKISARSEYACRALVELARCYPNQRVQQLKEIARAQAIPEKYLVHILLQLKQHGLISSMRGASGGYCLCLPPSKISLGEVIRIFDGPLLSLQTTTGHKSQGGKKEAGDFEFVWRQITAKLANVIDEISFADLLAQMQKHGKDLYQI